MIASRWNLYIFCLHSSFQFCSYPTSIWQIRIRNSRFFPSTFAIFHLCEYLSVSCDSQKLKMMSWMDMRKLTHLTLLCGSERELSNGCVEYEFESYILYFIGNCFFLSTMISPLSPLDRSLFSNRCLIYSLISHFIWFLSVESLLITLLVLSYPITDLFRPILCGSESIQEASNLYGQYYWAPLQRQKAPWRTAAHFCRHWWRLSLYATRYVTCVIHLGYYQYYHSHPWPISSNPSPPSMFLLNRTRRPSNSLHWRVRCRQNGEHQKGHSISSICCLFQAPTRLYPFGFAFCKLFLSLDHFPVPVTNSLFCYSFLTIAGRTRATASSGQSYSWGFWQCQDCQEWQFITIRQIHPHKFWCFRLHCRCQYRDVSVGEVSNHSSGTGRAIIPHLLSTTERYTAGAENWISARRL